VSFTDITKTENTTIRGWLWQFGDGTTSAEQNPQHTYHLPGAYTVSLTVDTDAGKFRSVKPNNVIVKETGTLISAQRSILPATPVSPGTQVLVNVLINCDDPTNLTALGLREILPEGWRFVDVIASGDIPDQIDNNPAQNTVAFAWIELPDFPMQFTYRIQAPEFCEVNTFLAGALIFRFTGPSFEASLEKTELLCAGTLEGEGEPVEGEGEPVEGEGEPIEGEGEPIEGEGEPIEGEGEPIEGEGEPIEGEGEPIEGEGEPIEGEGEPVEGEGEPVEGEGEPVEGEGEPVEGEGEPVEGEGEPVEGEGEPVEGEGEPVEGEGEPVEGEGEPVEGEGEPVEGEGEPVEGEGEPVEGEGEPVEGEGEPVEGEGEPVEGEGEPVEGEGEPNEGEVENYISIYMTRVDTTGNYVYTPSQPLEITVQLEKIGNGSPTNLRVYEEIPSGWMYSGLGTGTLPDQVPSNGATGELTFAWTGVTPVLPLTFSYLVTPPSSTVSVLFTGMAQYTVGGMDFYSNEAQTQFRRFETLIAIFRTIDPTEYAPAGTLDMTIHYVRYGVESPLVFGYTETLPPGWTYQGVVANEGGAPVITPEAGAAGILEFAWITPPTMPGSFTYRVSIPPSASGQALFSGYGLYRFTGAEQQTAISEISIPQVWP